MEFEPFSRKYDAAEPVSCCPDKKSAALRNYPALEPEQFSIVFHLGPFVFVLLGLHSTGWPDFSLSTGKVALLEPVRDAGLDPGKADPLRILVGSHNEVLSESEGREQSMIVLKVSLDAPTAPPMTGADAIRSLMGAHHLADLLRYLARTLSASKTTAPDELAGTNCRLVAVLPPNNGPVRIAAPSGSAVDQRHRIEQIIAANIASARLSPRRIAALAGISRSALYRLFDGSGGVAAYIRELRLALVCADLLDPKLSALPINEIARCRGLHCTASFNRAYRQVFGITPGETRAITCRRNAAPTTSRSTVANQTCGVSPS